MCLSDVSVGSDLSDVSGGESDDSGVSSGVGTFLSLH